MLMLPPVEPVGVVVPLGAPDVAPAATRSAMLNVLPGLKALRLGRETCAVAPALLASEARLLLGGSGSGRGGEATVVLVGVVGVVMGV